MKKLLTLFFAALMIIAFPALALAADAPAVDTGDTAFILVSSAMVMLMTPGLAFFYGGMVRRKNVLSTIMQSLILVGVVSVQWVLIGYTMAFGPDIGSLIGGFDFIGFKNVSMSAIEGFTIPQQLFAAFQMMFAIITTAIISGSIAERMKFPAFLAFTTLWVTIIYAPLAHWVWGGGWIFQLGALDFAGGTVVHISSGVSGLVAALVLGKRKGYGKDPMVPHNLPFTVLGTALLWFGWFGFNAGSALGANGLAASAFLVTNTSAAAAALSWVIVEWIHRGKPTVLGAASGGVAGLVAITPGAGFVTPLASIVIGLVGGAICYFAVSVLKSKFGYDDSLDAFGCHGIGGTWGAIATGLFATTAVNELGANGLFYGDPSLVVKQLISIVATYAFAGIGTFIILKVVGLFTQLRVTEEEEVTGLDLSLHGEEAYRDGALTVSMAQGHLKGNAAGASLKL